MSAIRALGVAITLLLGAWTFVAGLLTEHSASLATDLESTVYAAIDSAAAREPRKLGYRCPARRGVGGGTHRLSRHSPQPR